MHPIHPATNIPVQLCQYVVRNRLVPPFRLYLYLKLYSNGTLVSTGEEIKYLRSRFFKKRNFYKQLQKLKELGWIGKNEQNGILHIRSFDHLRLATNSLSKSRVKLFASDCETLKEFLFSSVVGARINHIKLRVKFSAELDKESSSQPNNRPSISYFGLGVKKISELTGYSTGQVQELKKRSEACEYIIINKKYKHWKSTKSELGNIKKAFPEIANRLWAHKGYVWERGHDEIIPCQSFSTARITRLVRSSIFKKRNAA